MPTRRPFCFTLALLMAFWLPVGNCCMATAQAAAGDDTATHVQTDANPAPHCHTPTQHHQQHSPAACHEKQGDTDHQPCQCDCDMLAKFGCLIELPLAVTATSPSERLLPLQTVGLPLPATMLPHTFHHFGRWPADAHAQPLRAQTLLTLGCLLTT